MRVSSGRSLLLNALGEHPDLSLGIGSREATVSDWRHLQIGYVGTSGIRAR